MPIGGSTHALMDCRLGVWRLGASRCDYYTPIMKVTIGGTDRTSKAKPESLAIREYLDGTPNTATLRLFGFTPTKGAEIKISMGSDDAWHYVFAGNIQEVRQVFVGPLVAEYDVNLISYEWLLNRRKVTQHFANMSASAIVTSIISTYTAGFMTFGIKPGLAVIDEITFTQADVTDCLDQLARRIGGNWVVDYGKDVRFGLDIDESIAAHAIVNSDTANPQQIGTSTDLSQVKTRILVEGEGSTALVARTAGDTTMPLLSVTFGITAGGVVVSGPQKITYIGKSTGGTGSTAAGKPLSPSAPSAAVASGTSGNLVIGARTYKATFVTGVGESELSAASGSVTISNLSAADAAGVGVSQVSNTAGNLTNAGARSYKVTYVTSAGETDNGGTASSGVTISNITPPGSAPSASVASGTAGNLSIGARGYAVSYVDAAGETTTGTNTSVTVTAVSNPSTNGSASGTTGGSLTASASYDYWVTFVDAVGETIAYRFAGVTLTGGQNAVSLSSIPTSGDGRVTKRKIYRTGGTGGTWLGQGLIATINDNSTTTATDTTADSALNGVPPPTIFNTSGSGQVNLTSIPTSSDGRVTKRRIYRTEAGGTSYKLLTTINDNSTTTYTDNTADASLGVDGPSVNTSGSGQIALTSIPTSGDGRTTKRRIYRTVAGGTAYKLVTTINDNSTTTYTDNVADGSLGVDLPTLNTSGSGQINVSSIPLGPTGTTARHLWRTEAGGSDYKFLKKIADNATTTFTDNVADSSLGDKAPSESHVGASAGDTALRVADCAVFDASGGWVQTASQVLRFTGRSVSSGEGNLTGVPASGVGSIAAAVAYGSAVVNAPFLSGIPASGAGSILYDIAQGDGVNLLVTVDDTTAQSAMAGFVGGDGIHEEYIQDRRLSAAEATARGQARLTLVKDPLVTITAQTFDQSARSGREITFNVTTPDVISGTYRIQSVTMTGFNGAGKSFPPRTIEASSRRLSVEAILRLIKAA